MQVLAHAQCNKLWCYKLRAILNEAILEQKPQSESQRPFVSSHPPKKTKNLLEQHRLRNISSYQYRVRKYWHCTLNNLFCVISPSTFLKSHTSHYQFKRIYLKNRQADSVLIKMAFSWIFHHYRLIKIQDSLTTLSWIRIIQFC